MPRVNPTGVTAIETTVGAVTVSVVDCETPAKLAEMLVVPGATAATAPFEAMVAVACSVPDCAAIVTVPAAEPDAMPPAPMLAMFESEELHWTELVISFVLPSESWAVAVNCCWAPIPIDIEAGET